MKLFNSKAAFHYEGDCNISKIFMRLSGLSFKVFALEKLPNGYAADGHFGPRVAKYDWFELLAKFPFFVALLTIAGVAVIFGLLWLCCSTQGLQKSATKKHSCCRCLASILLFLLLVPLVIGLYMTFRANFLLRKHKDNSMPYRDGSNYNSLTDNEELGNFKTASDNWNDTTKSDDSKGLEDLAEVLNKSVAKELLEWQQVMTKNEQTNFEKLKYLTENQNFYKICLRTLRDTAYELLIIGLEMDDLLRAFFRDVTAFVHASGNSNSSEVINLHSKERLNVWHLNSIYQRYAYLYELLEYLMTSYSEISKLQKSIANIRPNALIAVNGQLKAPDVHQFPSQRSTTPSKGNQSIPKIILYFALALLFLTAGVIYLLFMAVGFGTFRYYEEAKCLLKLFIGLSSIAILITTVLTLLHFLLTMVLHTDICHKNGFGKQISATYRSAAPLQCSAEYESLLEMQKRKDLRRNIENIIPTMNISYFNATDKELSSDESLQENWYEQDMQHLVSNEDYVSYREYIKELDKEGVPEVKLVLCKLHVIENTVKSELNDKEFVSNAALLYETATKVQKRAQSDGYKSLMDLLMGAESEIDVFHKFYVRTKSNFFEKVEKKLESKTPPPCSRDDRSLSEENRQTTLRYTKCGCLEDLLMIYSLGGTLISLSIFLAMLLSMLLHYLYKRQLAMQCNRQSPRRMKAQPNSANNPQTTPTTTCEDTRELSTATQCNRAAIPLINTVNFMPPVVGAVGCQPCQPNAQQIGACNPNVDVILPLQNAGRAQMSGACTSAEAQLVGGGRTKDKTVTVMIFQGPKDRQPLVTYPPPAKLERR